MHELADRCDGHVEIESLDVTAPADITSLRHRLTGRTFDVLFVNAGTTRDEKAPIGEVSTEDFVDVMVTNALGPMRVVDALKSLVPPSGLIGAMSSGQGSITNNTTGSRELYRGSKAALNMFVRSFGARPDEQQRALVVMAPGWTRTGLGGSDAPYTVEEVVPRVVDVLLRKRGRPGVEYLDRFGEPVPW